MFETRHSPFLKGTCVNKVILVFALLLSACAAPVTTKTSDTQNKSAPAGDFGECTLKIVQDGKETSVQTINGRPTYKLSAREFRIEVASPDCEPSITLMVPTEVAYVTQTPLIFGTGAYWMAGDFETADMLAGATGRNPRTTIEEEIQMSTSKVAWAQQQYKEVCDALKYCPTPVKHFATAWPFLDPRSQKNRGFAEFKRLDRFSTMSKAAGRTIHAVIYTKWRVLRTGASWNETRLYVLRPHLAVLDFSQ